MSKQMPQTVAIRGPEPRDRERWISMFSSHAAIGPEPCAEDAPDYVWDCVLDPDHAMKLLFSTDADDRPNGFILYLTHPYSWTRRPITYLFDLFVEPEARGQGIGSALLQRLADIGREAGWLKIYWMTQADNDKAHALYTKFARRSPLVRYDLHLNDY